MTFPASTPATQPPLLSLRGIAKSFGAVRVLEDIDLDIRPGEIHALIGANGAGKSTLGKIIAGYYRRDAGDMRLEESAIGTWSSDRAIRAGVAMIHQEIQLVPALSVADNVFLGQEQRRGGVLLRGNRARYAALDAETGFGIPGEAITGDLPLHLQQQVEILRALARRARLIVMDEPTAALGPREAERLHAVMADLKARGCAVVYVTHFLDHVLAHCDQVTVLRDGRLVESRPLAGLDRAGLIERMLGRVFTATFPPREPVADDAPILLAAQHVAATKPLRDASVTVRRGEIVGLLGLVGSGRTELLRALAGVDARTAGTVRFDGALLPSADGRAARDRGLVMVPEDRRGQGLLMERCVRENMTLPYLRRFTRFGLVGARRERAAVQPFMDSFGIIPADPEMNIRGHSGGNQQKVLLARWLMDSPRLIMLDEPTRGVDVGARERIYAAIAEMARSGMGVLLVSSDLEEVLGLSHRAYLVRDGRTVREIAPADWTSDDVLRTLFAAGDGENIHELEGEA